MIDFMEITIDCKHQNVGNILRNIDVSSGETRDYRKEGKVKNKYHNSLIVKSNDNGQRIKIKGNFVKYLQGHNIFGSNDLVGISYDVVKVILEQLDIPITDSELTNIKNGYFSVHMVDIAWNYRQDAELIPNIIDEVGTLWRVRGKDVSNYSNKTVYLNQHSNQFAFKLYNKKLELAYRSLPINLPERERLLKYTVGLLRAELRLHSKALRELRLNVGQDWSVDKVKEMIELALKQAEFSGSIYRRLIPDNVMQLKLKLRQAYMLWEDGHDLAKLYDSQVLRRLRNSFAEIGVDISNPPPASEHQEVNIASCFSDENKLNFPKWARTKGLIHIPKKLKK